MKKIGYLYVHEMAMLISDVAQAVRWGWLWEQGGRLELWADTKLEGE